MGIAQGEVQISKQGCDIKRDGPVKHAETEGRKQPCSDPDLHTSENLASPRWGSLMLRSDPNLLRKTRSASIPHISQIQRAWDIVCVPKRSGSNTGARRRPIY